MSANISFRLLVVLAVFLGLTGAPARAQLRYTLKIESQKSSEPPVAPAHPLLAILGGMIASTLAPVGGLEIVITTGERGSRVEYSQAYTVVPAGGIALLRPDGSITVIDPSAKTYWRMAKPDLSMIKPDFTITRTGERATIAGLDTERARLDIKVPLPVPPGTELPPGIPSTLVVTGETWLADRYKEYANLTSLLGGMISLGLERLSSEGLPMKSVLRGDMFGDQQVVSTITSIGEVTVASSHFEIPLGFAEVPPPTSVPGLGRP
jgi:hypothetical protein